VTEPIGPTYSVRATVLLQRSQTDKPTERPQKLRDKVAEGEQGVKNSDSRGAGYLDGGLKTESKEEPPKKTS